MQAAKNKWLILASICSAFAALAHLGCIIFGADWYRFFGAGEQMALLAESGHWYPTAVTSAVVFALSLFSLYALSGANLIGRLPLLKLGLVVISAIYLCRGLAFVLIMPLFPDNSLAFWLVSSVICLTIGILYFVGTLQSWALMGKNRR
ncbi:hypothetical protein N9L75_04760 [Porticoccaceae bacterium]|nr:hypothetical protein [Porticoccaceae bacterium]MDA8651869.1 hypothetical protein [Porticoccaceae bacterium]MDA8663594.1 hypothetical protein [Porticoccaceae bacterium]